MSFTQAIQTCFNKYATFSGRASVAEYWWFMLFCFLVNLVSGIINEYLGSVARLALLIPTLAVSWRRMHDIGLGGGWFFINFVPVVGWIIWIIKAVKAGEPSANRFGDVTAC